MKYEAFPSKYCTDFGQILSEGKDGKSFKMRKASDYKLPPTNLPMLGPTVNPILILSGTADRPLTLCHLSRQDLKMEFYFNLSSSSQQRIFSPFPTFTARPLCKYSIFVWWWKKTPSSSLCFRLV
jgi:hypothetical protein